MESIAELKIPLERVAVVIGKSGSMKEELEKKLECKLAIDSKEGDISISSDDALKLLLATDVIKAIGRGFNPDIALLLAKENFSLEIINLTDYSSKKNHQERIKGRVIGRDGRSRSIIEEHTECHISVFGKTIAIIGPAENVRTAHKAVTSLLGGSPHAYVYKWLERQRFTLHQPEEIQLKEKYEDSDEKTL